MIFELSIKLHNENNYSNNLAIIFNLQLLVAGIKKRKEEFHILESKFV